MAVFLWMLMKAIMNGKENRLVKDFSKFITTQKSPMNLFFIGLFIFITPSSAEVLGF